MPNNMRLLRQRLGETAKWIASTHSKLDSGWAAGRDLPFNEEFSCDEPEEAIARWFRFRRKTLTTGAGELDRPPADGRVLVYYTDINLCDGACHTESDGFFGEVNVPPPDSWIDFVVGLTCIDAPPQPGILCWIPDPFLSVTQAGINVNPEMCLAWLDDVEPDLDKDLMEQPFP